MLSVIYAECHYAKCHYAECHYAECHYAECQNVIMLHLITHNVIHYAECHNYCIEGISETPNASADFYCQSNTNNLTSTLCAFYVESSKVNHRPVSYTHLTLPTIYSV